ncbi:MAG: methyltransferase domain-containing protein [Mycobacterium sp.]|nr:methyltransferase domain-containing protein [Mycobacterium sp.]
MWPVICGGPMAPAQTCLMLAFYARYSPRLRGLSTTERESAPAVLRASLFDAPETPPLSDSRVVLDPSSATATSTPGRSWSATTDSSSRLVIRSRKRALASSVTSKVRAPRRWCDAENLPLPDASFDAVINVEAAHAYPHLSRFLAEVARVLRPGGDFLYADFRGRNEFLGWDAALADVPLRQVSKRVINDRVVRSLDNNAQRSLELDQPPAAGVSPALQPPFRGRAWYGDLQRHQERRRGVPHLSPHQGLSDVRLSRSPTTGIAPAPSRRCVPTSAGKAGPPPCRCGS